MDYEKIHKEAVKVARRLVSEGKVCSEYAEQMFPELKESEDERVRKALIRFHKSTIDIDGIKGEDILAWLEKQGEQKKYDATQVDEQLIEKMINDKFNLVDIPENVKCYYEQGLRDMYKQFAEELDLAFRHQDEVVYNEGYAKGKEDAIKEQKSTDKVESKFKVGDTIKCKYDDRQFTIKSVDLDKGTYTYTQEGCGNDIDYADEEFELVEHNPADKVEPKFKVGDIITPKDKGHEPWQIMQVDISDKKYRFKDGYVIHFSQEDDYELVEQKPTEWSEEDEKKRKGLIKGLEDRMGFGWACDPFSREEYIDWLKSLRPQNHWKPSLSQLNALGVVAKGNVPDDIEEINSLYNDLKKLIK